MIFLLLSDPPSTGQMIPPLLLLAITLSVFVGKLVWAILCGVLGILYGLGKLTAVIYQSLVPNRPIGQTSSDRELVVSPVPLEE